MQKLTSRQVIKIGTLSLFLQSNHKTYEKVFHGYVRKSIISYYKTQLSNQLTKSTGLLLFKRRQYLTQPFPIKFADCVGGAQSVQCLNMFMRMIKISTSSSEKGSTLSRCHSLLEAKGVLNKI